MWPYLTVPLPASLNPMRKQFFISSLVLLCSTACAGAQGPSASSPLKPRARTVFLHALPPLDGTRLQVTAVEVTYPPGGSSLPHTHPCPVIGYVLHGAVRMQVQGAPESLYKAGESFYEPPNGIHLVSKNASTQEPAIFLAYLICDHSAPLSTEVPQSKQER
jgi:quercetin dioxygenase-like cupin family protein